jgi:regulator of protease activity HflC (stomatin/prohibitin superfamily)
MEYLLIPVALIIGILLYEYRIRRPDSLLLYERGGDIHVRSARFYPRHFSLSLANTTYSFSQTIEATARGNLELRIRLAVSVAASLEHLATLVRVGGWSTDAVSKAAKELETVLLGLVKEHTERKSIDDLSSEGIHEYLRQRVHEVAGTLGIKIVTLTIASFEPVNQQIADAMRQREQARILEQAETLQQEARIAAARARTAADEQIAALENQLDRKRLALKRATVDLESALSSARAEHDQELKKMQLALQREEMRLLKDNPELLLLTPQAARLAEASQALKNARTVVSLSPGDAQQTPEILGLFQNLLQNAVESFRKKRAR